MTYEELIKQAFAYGITQALQEAGYEKTASDQYATQEADKLGSEIVGHILAEINPQ